MSLNAVSSEKFGGSRVGLNDNGLGLQCWMLFCLFIGPPSCMNLFPFLPSTAQRIGEFYNNKGCATENLCLM